MSGQHDHHCWVTFMGVNWKIHRVAAKRLVYLARAYPCPVHGWWNVEQTVMDIGSVDFVAYCEAAQAWDYRR